MKVYDKLSRAPLIKKKFSSKFLAVAFLGIHLPLIALIGYILLDPGHPVSLVRISLIVLAFTLISTIATLLILDNLLEPVKLAKTSLDKYLSTGELPKLPMHYKDEVGQLISHIQTTIEKLDRVLAEKGDMVDLLSHDLRSPIGRVIALANLVDDSENKEETMIYTTRIVEESQNLLTLLEDVLSMLKKADNNELTFHLVSTPIKPVMIQAAVYYEYAAKEKNISWHISVEDNLIANIEPVMFSQAIKNIIGNAIKFSPEGKNIYITSIAERKKLQLTIRDEGIGFEAKDREKIFERFTHNSQKGTRGESSTGLGLSLAKKIIEKHGGQLTATSEGIGKGATFIITLPRNQARTKLRGFQYIIDKTPFKRAG